MKQKHALKPESFEMTPSDEAIISITSTKLVLPIRLIILSDSKGLNYHLC